MATSAEHEHPNYVLIWVYLAALTGVELTVALLHFLPRHALVITLVLLAIWKALLVALYFMHLKFEPKKLLVVVLAPLPLALILLMFVFQERFK
ncbi:MAG: cytochrome C oxidase subunit IV family protein [Gemmatimonadales bacterium]